MTFLAPLAFGLAVLLPLIVLFYLLKVRRQDMEVSSTLLWDQLLRDLAAHEPFQRLRVNVLLIAQLLLLSLLTFALARPLLAVGGRPTEDVVLVMDLSASMQASDASPTRFEAARRQAIELAAGFPEGTRFTIIAAASQPQLALLSSTDSGQARRTLQALEPTDGPADVPQALLLADSLAGRGPRQLHVFTDGAFETSPGQGLERLRVQPHWVAGAGQNLAITALSAREALDDRKSYQVFARVQNFGSVDIVRELALVVDSRPQESREFVLGAGKSHELLFRDIPPGAGLIEAHLQGGDALPIDDTAYAVLDTRGPSQVLLVSDGNLFLERVLGLLPRSEVYRVTPGRYLAVDHDRFDVVVFDGYVPSGLPRGNVLVFNPSSSFQLPVTGEARNLRLETVDREHPLLRYVDLRDLGVARARLIEAPDWLKPLAAAQRIPLILAGEQEGRRMALFAFDLRQSNLPLSAAFPILMSNLIEYLGPLKTLDRTAASPGSQVALKALPQAEEIVVEWRPPRARNPAKTIKLTPVAGEALMADAARVGVYAVTQRAGARALASETFVASLLDAQESDIRLRAQLGADDESLEATEPTRVPPGREAWGWLALAALAVLTFEWWWFHRKT